MEYLRVGPMEFYGAGFETLISARDVAQLEAQVAVYDFHEPALWVADIRSERWDRRQPVWVHRGEVPPELFKGTMTAAETQAALARVRESAEAEACAKAHIKGQLTFGTFNISVDGKSLHIVVWDNWTE